MKNFRSCLVGFRRLLHPFRSGVAVAVAIGLVKVAASLAFVWINRTLVDIATGENSMNISLAVGILIGIVLLQIGCEVFSGYWGRVFSIKATNRLRYDSFRHVLESSWNGKETFHSGDTTNRLFEDIRLVVNVICIRVPEIAVTACQLVAASFYLMSLQADLLWFLLALMVLVAALSKIFFRKLRSLSSRIRDLEASTQQQMQENLINRALALTLFGTEKILEKLGYTMKETEELTVERQKFISLSRLFMGLGFMGGYSAAFLWGVFGIRSGAVTFGMMTAFLQLVGQIQRPVASLSSNIPDFINSLTSVERLMELDELPDTASQDRIACEKAPSIVLSNVSFSYPFREDKVLDNFNYTFEAGKLTLITGPTGAGKSTLIRIVMGLLTPSEGEVTLFSNDSYMYVPQGNSLLSGTIRENLLLANGNATEEEMKRALHMAAADFVMDFPDGLDSACGEVGSGLSEGQAQRVAIARALLHSGHILILDEATSALDAETENEVISNLASGCRGDKTILFVSHREAVAKYADFLLSLQIISNLR